MIRKSAAMHWILANIKGIMLVSGALTCTMFFAAIAPQAALRSIFGKSLSGPVAEIVVRNWGALITLVGGMLIYGAFNPSNRSLVLVVAGLGKLIFIGLILACGNQYLHKAVIAMLVDVLMISFFIIYRIGLYRNHADSSALANPMP